jgi:Capsule assembly protein Wzi
MSTRSVGQVIYNSRTMQHTGCGRRIRAALAAAGAVSVVLWIASPEAGASGASPYLPLNLSPEIERQVERVLVLGGHAVLTRPVPIATVLEALPKACKRDAVLCRQVKRYLNRYFGQYGVTEGSVEVAAPTHSTTTDPNQRGERLDSPFDASVVAFYRPYDHLLITAGGVGYAGTDGRFNPDGTMLSAGNQYLQVDAGYRSQWLSPMTDSSMLISTEAPTMPSLTVSNQQPIGPLGLQYQLFVARMSYSDHILWNGVDTAGYPRLAGIHLGVEPVSGWSFAGNAVWQFGGGGRPGSFSDFFRNLFQSTNFGGSTSPNLDDRFSNRAVSLTSAYTFPTRTPFEAYVEYAGRDTFHGEFYHFRETDLSAGLHFPEFLNRFDLTIEASEWQNSWYTDYVWLDGMTVDGYVTGNWGADWRTFSNAVGAQSEMISLGWPMQSGDYAYARLRTLQNQQYEGEAYSRAYMLTLEYSQPRNGYTRGLQIDTGRDSFGSGFARLAAFVRFDGGRAESSESYEDNDEDTEDDDGASKGKFERFVDLGVSGGHLALDLGGFNAAEEAAPQSSQNDVSPHLGVGVRRAISTYGDLGVRAEFDDFHGAMIALRAFDYRYRLSRHLAVGGFFGFARYSAPTPAQGYYVGAGLTWRNLFPRWDLSFDARYFDHVQRDKVLPSDPQNGDPVEWYTMQAASLYLSRRF